MVVELIYKLQSLFGLRISEVLDLRTSDFIGRNKILIRGKKGSGNRIIVVDFTEDLKDLYTHCNGFIFNGINRFFVYREYKKLGYIKYFNGAKNAAVTHLPRHLYIAELSGNGVNTEDIQANIRHKSIKSTEHYERKNGTKRQVGY